MMESKHPIHSIAVSLECYWIELSCTGADPEVHRIEEVRKAYNKSLETGQFIQTSEILNFMEMVLGYYIIQFDNMPGLNSLKEVYTKAYLLVPKKD